MRKHMLEVTYVYGSYFVSTAAFQAMHSSPIHDRAGEEVRMLLDGKPTPKFYEVIEA